MFQSIKLYDALALALNFFDMTSKIKTFGVLGSISNLDNLSYRWRNLEVLGPQNK